MLIACEEEKAIIAVDYPALMEIPEGFPPIDAPDDNEFSQARWELGKALFYDPILSRDSTISCASCHHAQLAFSDNTATTAGIENRAGVRNVLPLFNLAYHPYFLREGSLPTLEMQVIVPIQEHNEFDFNMVLLVDKLNESLTYKAASLAAYDRQPDAFVVTRSIACFERSLLSGDSKYDKVTSGNNGLEFTDEESRGQDLFFSETTNCSQCHNGFNFTDYSFQNNGLYEVYNDDGRYRHTLIESDRALFKVPSLRNLSFTAPYMHDGSYSSLQEVLLHYNSGGANHPHKSPFVKPLNLSQQELDDLMAFLLTLSDSTYISNPLFIK